MGDTPSCPGRGVPCTWSGLGYPLRKRPGAIHWKGHGTSGSIMARRWGTPNPPMWTDRHMLKQYLPHPLDVLFSFIFRGYLAHVTTSLLLRITTNNLEVMVILIGYLRVTLRKRIFFCRGDKYMLLVIDFPQICAFEDKINLFGNWNIPQWD